MFALTLVPLLLIAGGAVDYGRTVAVRTELSHAADSAALAAAQFAMVEYTKKNRAWQQEARLSGQRSFTSPWPATGSTPVRRRVSSC